MTADPTARPALPFVVAATPTDTALTRLIDRDRGRLRALLAHHGALLFRGFPIGGTEGFEAAVRALSGAPLPYANERSSPRHAISGHVYTSTDYPRDEEIFLHNENSYQVSWPRLLYFYCARPARTRGATPLGDTREVYAAIDPEVREEFRRRRWMLVRNMHERIGSSWKYAFDTDDRQAVEEYCHRRDVAFEWTGRDSLRTRAVREPIHRHPETGQAVWFNHITFFHYTTLPEDVRDGLLGLVGEEGLPTNTYYGDGGRIPDEVIAHLRDCYRAAYVRRDWEQDDILVVDNMLSAHGREPYTGDRSIAVAMAESYAPVPAAAGTGREG